MGANVCLVGGGPAGLMMGYLLARAGIRVTVLEKHEDFLRDFRGDTVHPSTLEVFHRLGLGERFFRRAFQRIDAVNVSISGFELPVADFSKLRVQSPFIAMMPQWEFLDFLAGEARAFPNFQLLMRTAATDLLIRDGRVTGVRARGPEGDFTVAADLVVGADGRQSTVRRLAGLPVRQIGAPIDALWLRIPRTAEHPESTMGRIDPGRMFVMINRQDYWQCAFVIPKNGFDAMRERGLAWFRSTIVAMAPFLAEAIQDIRSWDQVKLLSVQVDRLERWARPGVLCIGDAAHAMSPVGGVGINLAVQDAVAAARILTTPLKQGGLTVADLDRVQRRRMFPTSVTQAAQVLIHRNLIQKVMEANSPLPVPFALRLLERSAMLRRLPAYAVGMGVRPEYP